MWSLFIIIIFLNQCFYFKDVLGYQRLALGHPADGQKTENAFGITRLLGGVAEFWRQQTLVEQKKFEALTPHKANYFWHDYAREKKTE